MIQLDTIVLPDSMVWVDEFEYTAVRQETTRTLGGTLVVASTPLVAGRPITLVANLDHGWITYDQVQKLEALSTQAGGVFSLTTHTGAFSVMFRHSSPPAFAAQPIRVKQQPLVDDLYTATIKLITI